MFDNGKTSRLKAGSEFFQILLENGNFQQGKLHTYVLTRMLMKARQPRGIPGRSPWQRIADVSPRPLRRQRIGIACFSDFRTACANVSNVGACTAACDQPLRLDLHF